MKATVTGGAGFIGHHLVGGLIARGDEVAVLDDLSTGDAARLEPLGDRIGFAQGTVLDAGALDHVFAGSEVVFHLAAVVSVERSLREPGLTDEVNARGTIEVMLAAARHNVRRVVLAGSCAVYGPHGAIPSREDQAPAPASPYAVSKLAAEGYLHGLGAILGVETVALRYFNVFGPGQDPGSPYAAVVPRFVTAALEGRTPVINGDGEISRDYVYVGDVIRANLLAAAAGVPSGLTCNVATGTSHSLFELVDAIGAALGREIVPAIGPWRAGDIRHSRADISRAQGALGYEVTVPFAEAIARTAAWYRERLGVPVG